MKMSMKVNSNCLATKNLQNIFYVPQKKEIHSGLEQNEDEYMIKEFSFCVNHRFKSHHIQQINKIRSVAKILHCINIVCFHYKQTSLPA